MSDYIIEPVDAWALCDECAGAVWGRVEPTAAYRRRIAELLFGTIAQESGFRWVRQTAFRARAYWQPRGAFGITQLEPGSMTSSLDYLARRPDVAARAAAFIWRDSAAGAEAFALDIPATMRLIVASPRAAIAFARLHYLWWTPDPIPSSTRLQADYWKANYNTVAGAGTVDEYLRNWRRYAPEAGLS